MEVKELQPGTQFKLMEVRGPYLSENEAYQMTTPTTFSSLATTICQNEGYPMYPFSLTRTICQNVRVIRSINSDQNHLSECEGYLMYPFSLTRIIYHEGYQMCPCSLTRSNLSENEDFQMTSSSRTLLPELPAIKVLIIIINKSNISV